MRRYWLNLRTLRWIKNDLDYLPAREHAEHTIGKNIGWFESVDKLNEYLRAELIPVLEAAWKKNPQLRLGQLISNAAGADHDVFYVPDGEMREQLWLASQAG